MALVHLNFESQYLHSNTDVNVVLPDRPRRLDAGEFYSSGKKYPVLYLLHGTFGDYSDWIRHTNIELYACEKNMIVVMPSALNSDYNNWPKFALGYDMESFLIKELMPLICNWFPASSKREDTFIAGLSMGAHGAARYAAWYPEKFAAAAILSGSPINWRALDMEHTAGGTLRTQNQLDNEGGLDGVLAGHSNVWDQIDALANTGKLPRLYIATGTEDFLYERWYLPFKKHAEEIGLDAEFEEIEGYQHEWRFWDITIQHALDFFLSGDGEIQGNLF